MFIDVGWFWLLGAFTAGVFGGFIFANWCWTAGGRYSPPEWER
jgi:hypothetical protein